MASFLNSAIRGHIRLVARVYVQNVHVKAVVCVPTCSNLIKLRWPQRGFWVGAGALDLAKLDDHGLSMFLLGQHGHFTECFWVLAGPPQPMGIRYYSLMRLKELVLITFIGVSINEAIQKWLVYFMEIPMKMDDNNLGTPMTQETTIWLSNS